MNHYIRIIDANLNRVAEGIRVIEDIFRFKYENAGLTSDLRNFRHRARHTADKISQQLIDHRFADHDPGLDISVSSTTDQRQTIKDLIHANFKRIQEGLRSIEENLKLIHQYPIAKQYEQMRFESYIIEKKCCHKLPIKRNCLNTDIYCLTAESLSCGRSNIAVVKEMIHAGIKLIQYREKDKSFQEKYHECKIIRALTQKNDVTFLINDHVDLALMVQADGVHMGQTDYPVEAVRKLAGDQFIIGLSTHSPEEARRAQDAGVDYIGVGPIYRTQTKKDVCEPVGHAYLDYVVEHISIPFVAIGGIKLHNIHEIVQRGASCVALVSEITGTDHIGQMINNIRNKIKEYQK
jgi:thiamine-phosphate pyrophosphorylase